MDKAGPNGGAAPEQILVQQVSVRSIVPVINDEPIASVALTVVGQETAGPRGRRSFDIIMTVEAAARLIEGLPEHITQASLDADALRSGEDPSAE